MAYNYPITTIFSHATWEHGIPQLCEAPYQNVIFEHFARAILVDSDTIDIQEAELERYVEQGADLYQIKAISRTKADLRNIYHDIQNICRFYTNDADSDYVTLKAMRGSIQKIINRFGITFTIVASRTGNLTI